MSRYLMIDFGSTFTKLTAVDTEKEDIIAKESVEKIKFITIVNKLLNNWIKIGRD